MTTPARILRAMADIRETDREPMTEKQRQRHERILTLSQGLFAEAGRHNITFTNLAIALRMGTATLRWHFADLDALLAAIIRRHLRALSRALAQIPRTDPDWQRKRRAAYLAFTRNADGSLTEPHLLFTRETQHLPDDERLPIERLHRVMGEKLAGKLGLEAMLLLDLPSLDAIQIEAALAAIQPADSSATNIYLLPPLPVPRLERPELWARAGSG
jgi:AcrR family transcriptional regulator